MDDATHNVLPVFVLNAAGAATDGAFNVFIPAR